jgi:hypothetical protein
MRSTIAACAILVLLIGTANAEQCPPGALGVSRTLVVDPNEHPRVGSMQYPETRIAREPPDAMPVAEMAHASRAADRRKQNWCKGFQKKFGPATDAGATNFVRSTQAHSGL